MCRFGGEGAGAAEAEMDEDVYAQRIWERMEQKKRAASGPSAAARAQWGQADDASARRQVLLLAPTACMRCCLFSFSRQSCAT